LVSADRIAALRAGVRASAVHAMWAERHTGPVHAALLVTPPWFAGATPAAAAGPIRRKPAMIPYG
jgi:hypothetical protein